MKKTKIMKIAASMLASLLIVCLLAPMGAQAKTKSPVFTEDQKTAVNIVFDADYYAAQYPDIAQFLGYDKNAMKDHYMTYGIKEGRSASASFNATSYRNRYSDLNAIFGDDMLGYAVHYVVFGIKEGRDASPDGSGLATASVAAADAAVYSPGTLISTYTTKYSTKQSRAINIALAAMQINGTVIAPGETFSYLSKLTPRTIENGYVVAPVFSGGKHSTGVGGGICQVSSTIYSAVVFTGVQIVERHPHSLPVTYVPKGMDATVSAPNIDFRFKNTFNQNIYLEVIADKGLLTVNVYLQ